MSAASGPPKTLAESFARFVDAQREAAAIMAATPHPGTPADWAEGYRWVTRIASLCLDWIVEKGDPLRPVLFRSQDEQRKLIVDNPDVNYYFAALSDGEAYRLHGNRGGACYVGLTIGTDVLRGGGARTGTLAQRHLDQFEIAPDGSFEISLSREPRAGNWIELAQGAAQLAVRETFGDRRAERPASLRLARLGPPLPAPVLEPDALSEKLDVASRFLLFVTRVCVGMWAGAAAQTNRFAGAMGAQHVRAQEDEIRTHSDAEMAYVGGRFALAPGQALRVTVRPPRGGFRYWGLTLANPWMESFDYRYARNHTNHALAERSADGSWRLVIAPRDPGLPNWLDTGGRLEGFMLIRWVLPAELPPAPECELLGDVQPLTNCANGGSRTLRVP
jgi:hypothetical protein